MPRYPIFGPVARATTGPYRGLPSARIQRRDILAETPTCYLVQGTCGRYYQRKATCDVADDQGFRTQGPATPWR